MKDTGDSPMIECRLNGVEITLTAGPLDRLSEVLRRNGFCGTKVGCDAGDCGACTVLIDGAVACGCLVPAAQAHGCAIDTVEGLAEPAGLSALQQSFARHGAAQCGICTPGMLVCATHLLQNNPHPTRTEVEEALGGVLCRCTGYRKIIDAVLDVQGGASPELPACGSAIGARVERLDGVEKITGRDLFAADTIPADALWLRLIRSPHHRAAFEFGDIDAWRAGQPGIRAVFSCRDIPGRNVFGVIPPFADQVVFAEHEVRFRGEAVAAVVGTEASVKSLDLNTFPVTWHKLPASLTPADAMGGDAALLHTERADNVLVKGLVQRGDAPAALHEPHHQVSGKYSTPFIEHAYIEPEAGYATRVGDRIEVYTCTQTAGMAQEDLAEILALSQDQVRVIPTAVGGGFGSKLDLSIQPFLCIAAWHLKQPVAAVYSRIESMQTTTKRHPSEIEVSVSCDANGRLQAMDFYGVFNTGAYASWGPTVANRVPIHASGPYYVPHYRARSVAVHTNTPPAGAFRGFGVPQAAIAVESLLDKLADKAGVDRLQFRIDNALRNDMPTVTGQTFSRGVGIAECLQALQCAWSEAGKAVTEHNRSEGRYRRGRGLGTCWYGCGNTSLPNPSTIKIAVDAAGRVQLHQGAIDIGQGANTVIAQIAADSLGAALEAISIKGGDTDITPDAGKTSASRQTFVSGNAAKLAAASLRRMILREVNASASAQLEFGEGVIRVTDDERVHTIDLSQCECDDEGYVLTAIETYDPPTTDLDANGQGAPYAQYGYGAQLIELTVDMELGCVKLDKLTTAHDVGRAINPLLIEGQIEGGATQGIGMALMEEFVPGVAENLHDYLIPTIGDIPEFEHHILEIEDAEGPFGAKGLGEHVLIPTAPAILNAIRDATGAEVRDLPATPDRVLAAIRQQELPE
jgi:CO/xanthine dehydrogenase Mo-binding subunit/aerobic-type carbon monoxide dehydrogenase small subunit (CoxS/CutS family)